MVRATQRELLSVGLEKPEVVLADAGYWHKRQIENVVSDGMIVLVPPDAGLRKGTRPGWTGGAYEFMRRVLASPEGGALYRRRQVTIEPVFGKIKFTRAIRRLPAPRQGSLQKRMAVDRRHPQPPQAPQPPARREHTLKRRAPRMRLHAALNWSATVSHRIGPFPDSLA